MKVSNYEAGSGIPKVTTTASITSAYEVSDDREFYPEVIILSNPSSSNAMAAEIFDYDSTDGEGDNSNHAYPQFYIDTDSEVRLTKEDLVGLCLKNGLGIKVGHSDGIEIYVAGEEKGGPNRDL